MRGIRIPLCLCCLWAACLPWALAADKAAIKDEPLFKERKWREAETHYARKLIEFAESKGPKSDRELVRLVLCHDIGRYFRQMTDEAAASLTAWLLDEPDFAAMLLGAFRPEDSPPRAFQVLGQLLSQFGPRSVLGFPGLAIAHAVVWDAERPISKKFTAADSFGFYAANAGQMEFDLAHMPYEAALFLACTEASPQERLWAAATYRGSKALSTIFHTPPYDMPFLLGGPKKIDGHEYTLPNLVQYGGVCGDRAYFAANVVRSLGIPAARISGQGERGGHAWIGYLRSARGYRFTWDLTCGRYEFDRYYTGVTLDPQTRQLVADYELAMKTMQCNLSDDKVRAADCYGFLARVLEEAKKFALTQWGIDQALKSNRFNLAAWDQAIRLCQKGVFDEAYAERVLDEALKTFRDELDFCYGVFHRLVDVIPEAQLRRRQLVHQQALNYFHSRPDLCVAIAEDYGDYLLKIGRRREAYDVFYSAINSSEPRFVADLAIKFTSTCLKDDDPKRAVTLLKGLINAVRKPAYGDPYARTSAWFRLCKCLKDVHTVQRDKRAADAIEAELSRFRAQAPEG